MVANDQSQCIRQIPSRVSNRYLLFLFTLFFLFQALLPTVSSLAATSLSPHKLHGPQIKTRAPSSSAGNLKVVEQLPDLIIRQITVDDKSPAAGSTIKISATVYNPGRQSITGIAVHFSFQGQQWNKTINQLDARKSAEIVLDIKVKEPPGVQILDVTVNKNRKIKESDYNNNQKRIVIQVTANRVPSLSRQPGASFKGPLDQRGHTSEPDLLSLQPRQIRQGTTLILKARGKDIKTNMQFDFGTGIVQTARILPGDYIRIPIKVAADCPPGLHRVTIVDGRQKYQATAVLLVLPAIRHIPEPQENEDNKPALSSIPITGQQPISHLPKPVVTLMRPNRWLTDQQYQVTILGRQLDEVTKISLGKGVIISDLKHQGKTALTLSLKVKDDADIGTRKLLFQEKNREYDSGLRGWVLKKQLRFKRVPPLVWQEQALQIKQGEIYLLTPEWKPNYNAGGTFHKAELNDQTILSWRERDPGLADEFEIRFMAPDGTILMRKSLHIVPPAFYQTSFMPDIDTVVALLKKLAAHNFHQMLINNNEVTSTAEQGNQQTHLTKEVGVTRVRQIKQELSVITSDSGAHIQFMPPAVGDLAVTEIGKYLKAFGNNSYLLWQVVGYKYIAGQKTITAADGSTATTSSKKHVQQESKIEIERSEQWPLLTTNIMPTGVTCDAQNQFSLTNDWQQPDGWDQEDQNLYPGTIVKISGKFSLDNSPWVISAHTTSQQVQDNNQGSSIYDESYHFNNVIIDWGDGQWQPLETEAPEPGDAEAGGLPGWSEQDIMNLQASHQYDLPGTYQVRAYVVPQGQMDRTDAIVSANRYRPPQNHAASGVAQPILVAAADLTASDAGFPLLTNNGKKEFAEKLGRIDADIFMLYCEPLEITIVQDTAATGPLQLDSIEILSFSSEEVAPPHGAPVKLNKGSTPQKGASAPEVAVSAAQTAVEMMEPAAISGQHLIPMPDIPKVSSCAGGLWGTARLKYYGQGYARVTWFVDGVKIDSRELKIGPSELRKDLDVRDPGNTGKPITSDFLIPSPRFPVQDIGQHKVKIAAAVIPDPTYSLIDAASLQYSLIAFQQEPGNGPGAAGKKGSKMSDTNLPAVPPAAGDESLQLLPVPSAGNNNLQEMADSFQTVLGNVYQRITLNLPPYGVTSKPKPYLVQGYTGDAPCRLLFPTKEGQFEIADLQNMTSQGSSYQGNGLFIFKFPDGPYSSSEYYLPVSFQNWQVPDKSTVTQGSLAIQHDIAIDTIPGMKAQLQRLDGTAGEHVNAVLDITIKDPTLRLAASETPQSWLAVSSPLSPDGDWYAEGLHLGHSRIGWSLMTIESEDIRLDLSRTRGDAPQCGSAAGANWVGIHLGASTLHPYTFNLEDIPIQVDGWSIQDAGICGKAETGGFSHVFGDGDIGWANLVVNAGHGNVSARYENFFIDMAWPKIRLESNDTRLSYSPGSDVDIHLNLNLPTIEENYDTIDMKVLPKSFKHTENGWGLKADTEFNFRDKQGGVFAEKVPVNDLFFTIYSDAIYAGSTIGLNISGQLGGAIESISALNVSTGGGDGATKLSFDFTSQLFIEGLGTALYPVHMLYGIEKNSGQSAVSAGPQHPGEIVFKSNFPETATVMSSEIRIFYRSEADQLAGIENYPLYAALFDDHGTVSDGGWDYPLLAGEISDSGGGCGNDTFGGRVDSRLFGDQTTSVEGTFRFGTDNGEQYWLAYLKGDNLHIPIFIATSLEMVQGGLAYNFAHNAFTKDGGFNACPAIGKGLLFSSGMGIAVGGPAIIEADGILTIQKNESFYEMVVDALLFQTIDLSGRLRYWGSSFDGEVWGNISLLDDVIYLEAPEHSIGIGMDSISWYFHAGTSANPLTGHLTSVLQGDTYMMLGSDDGFKVGADASKGINKTYSGFGFDGSLDVEGSLDLQTNPLRFDGTIKATASGKLINPVKDIGVSTDVKAWIGSPAKLGFRVSKSCCCVSAHVSIDILPSLGAGGGAECTCCDPRDWF